MVDERAKAVRPLPRVHLPVTERTCIVRAPDPFAPEPTVVENETLRADGSSAVGNRGQGREILVHVYRFPAVVVDQARSSAIRPRHEIVAEVALEPNGGAVHTLTRPSCVKRRGLEVASRHEFRTGGVAKLNLAATVRKLLSDHSVASRPAVVHRIDLARGVSRAAARKKRTGKMLVAAAPGARLSHPNSGSPWCPDKLELA